MTEEEERLNRLIRLRIIIEQVFGKQKENDEETIDDYIYTEQREFAWLDSERNSGQNFTKSIYTPLPTKRRRRVTHARMAF